jgi:hypothetical protein
MVPNIVSTWMTYCQGEKKHLPLIFSNHIDLNHSWKTKWLIMWCGHKMSFRFERPEAVPSMKPFSIISSPCCILQSIWDLSNPGYCRSETRSRTAVSMSEWDESCVQEGNPENRFMVLKDCCRLISDSSIVPDESQLTPLSVPKDGAWRIQILHWDWYWLDSSSASLDHVDDCCHLISRWNTNSGKYEVEARELPENYYIITLQGA